ncbi:MAG: hypothetical protein KF800_11230 [Lysobacter sp.]|nr:hypothetical protein [Lysobacter sp.]
MSRSVFVSLLLGAVLAMPPVASIAQEPAVPDMPEPQREDLSFKVRPGVAIDVRNPYGDVNVRFGGYVHDFDMHTTLQQPAGAARIEMRPAERDGRFVVEPRLPDGVVLAEGQRLDLVLYVPQDHALSVRTEFGTIDSRNTKSAIRLSSKTGNIFVRGNEGPVVAESDEGNVSANLTSAAPRGSRQRFASRTGRVSVEVIDNMDVEVLLASSTPIATDFSLQVEHLDGREPNKRARAVVGRPGEGKDKAEMTIESLAGDIRLSRRAVFVDPE